MRFVQSDRQLTRMPRPNPKKIVVADLLRRLDLPFFTTREQGSGVGLALVRYVMLSYGGAACILPGPTAALFFG